MTATMLFEYGCEIVGISENSLSSCLFGYEDKSGRWDCKVSFWTFGTKAIADELYKNVAINA
jgi:hypothetical protein